MYQKFFPYGIMIALTFFVFTECLIGGIAADRNNDEKAHGEKAVNKIFRYVPSHRGFGDPMPFYWKGEYHVFYLTNPAGNYDVNWEHIVSTDLIHWKELPTALSVDKSDPTGPDGGCIFTGDVIEKDGIFHAWYTSWNPLNPDGREFISHATSTDLNNWTKHPEHIVAPDGIHYANHPTRDFRDPEIFWNEEAGEYWLFMFANVPNEYWGRMALLTSDDLINWEQHIPLEGLPGDECPSYMKFGDVHYIIGNDYGYHYSENVSGPYKQPKFWNSIQVDVLDSHGQAAKTIWDGERYLWFGGWTGRSMPIPREINAGPDGLLYMTPANEIVDYFNKTALDLTENAADNEVVDVPYVYMLDYQVIMDPKSQITISFGRKYSMSLIPSRAALEVNGPGVTVDRPVPIDTSKPVKIQAFVDATLIEFFINDQFAQSCIIEKWWPLESTIKFSGIDGTDKILKCQLLVHE